MAADVDRQYQKYILDFMHILKFFVSVTDQWTIKKKKLIACDHPLTRPLENENN